MKENYIEIFIMIAFAGSILGIPPETIFDALVRLALAVIGISVTRSKRH